MSSTTQSKISTQAAKTMIHKLKKENLTNEEIARRLRTAGYVGKKGTPIEAAGVGWHVREMASKKVDVKLSGPGPGPAKEAGPTSPDHSATPDRFKLVRDLLNSNMDPDTVRLLALKVLS